MKKTITALSAMVTTLLGGSHLHAQNEAPLGKVTYIQTVAYKTDSGAAPKEYLDRDMTLYFGKISSAYMQLIGQVAGNPKVKTAGGSAADSALAQLALEEAQKKLPGLENQPKTGSIMHRPYNAEQVKTQNMYNGELYLVEEKAPAIDWTIQEATKQVGKYNCRKATANFLGRTYEAWFTTDIPVTAGPWKLGGLPGLILEAADSKQEVVFKLASLDIPNPDAAVMITGDLAGKKMTMDEYTAEMNKQIERMTNMFKASGAKVSISTKELVPMEK